MGNHTDLRVVRTRQMIKNAFLELMEEVGFAKITVEGITKKAFISRNTFYLHYTDKFDLLNSIEDETLLGVKDIVKEMPFEIMRTKGLADSKPISILIAVYQYISDNSRFFSLMIKEGGDPRFLHKMTEMMKDLMNQNNMETHLRTPQRYMVAIIAGIQTSIIGEWLRGGMKETPEELANLIAALFESAPKNLLKSSE